MSEFCSRSKAVAGTFMNPVQGARRAPWTGFMNVPATAFDLLALLRVKK